VVLAAWYTYVVVSFPHTIEETVDMGRIPFRVVALKRAEELLGKSFEFVIVS
jgi:ABC-type hemin transport system ATPase subunit